MSRYFCIGFINFMRKGKSLADLFFHQIITKKNDDIILNYFKNGWST